MDNNNLYSDFVDEIANLEFQEFFYSKFENSKLTFCSDSLQHCLKQVTEEKKPLIFFLHNENDENSQKCCKMLNKEDVVDFINKHFIIIGWKINNDDINFTKNLSDRVLIAENIRQYIENVIPCIFTIIPNMGSVKVYQELKIRKENTEKSDWLLSNLRQVQKQMSLFVKQEDFVNMTSLKYQQWMYEELGDRDYDSFESTEHIKLKLKLLYAMFGPPDRLSELEALRGYDEKKIQAIEKIYDKIKLKNNEYSKWNDRIVIAFIYNCLEALPSDKKKTKTDETDRLCAVPVFVLRKCKVKKGKENEMIRSPCRIFIDDTGRVYENWTKYLEKNTLPPRKMIYPANGKYQEDPNNLDEVWLDSKYTPSSSKTAEFLKAADIGSTIAGVLSSAVLVAGTFTPLAVITAPALVAGVTTGVYAVGRGAGTLVDRKQHEQSINITNSESRGAYLNISAGVIGAVGAGATKILTHFVRSGANVGKGTLYAVNIINGTNIAIAGTATANGFYEVFQQWPEEGPSNLTLLQLGTSLFFFGNSLVNFRTAGTIVAEAQASTLTDINQALRSNRQRKTFNKLLKETTRLQGNTKGRAEVIRAMSNTVTRDEGLAVLTRSNKNFNQNGIRFSAEGGGIVLNGVPVDILEFGNMPKSQQSMYFETLPSIPENRTPTRLSNTRTIVKNMQFNDVRGFFGLTNSIDTIVDILAKFKVEIQQKVIAICENFMNLIDIKCIEELRRLLPFGDLKTNIIMYVANFINKSAIDIKNIFESRLLNEDVVNVCKEFGFSNPHLLINDFIDYVVAKFTVNNIMMETLLCDFQTWVSSLIYNDEIKAERKKERHKGPAKLKKDCPTCGGYYYN